MYTCILGRMVKKLFFSLMLLLTLTILADVILRERYSRNELLFRTEREGGGIKIESATSLSNVPGEWLETVGSVQWLRHNNGQGLRENYELPCGSMPPDADRVVVALGDSWIYGFGLTQNKTLPDLLVDSLSVERERVEVVNAGVIGGSAFDELMS